MFLALQADVVFLTFFFKIKALASIEWIMYASIPLSHPEDKEQL